MIARALARLGRTRRLPRAAAWLGLALLLAGADAPDSTEERRIPTNAAVYVSTRELLFYSAPVGAWTAYRLDAGEQLLQRGVDGNVAAVATSLRVVGFSGPLNAVDELRLPSEEGIEAFKVEGNLATVLTSRRALGFSAQTGRWAAIDRFYLGR